MAKRPADVSTYIASAPPQARSMLRVIRRAIHKAAPRAAEKISYGMPYYGLHGRLAYFAAFKSHVSFFVMGSATRTKFAKQLRPYLKGVATLKFPIGTAVPVTLIKRLVQERMAENESRMKRSVRRSGGYA